MAAHDARILLVTAVVRAQACMCALQQGFLTARAAHIIQQDGQCASLPELGALGGSHRVRKAQLAAHHGRGLVVPAVVTHSAPAATREHLHAPTAWTQARGPHQAYGAI